MVTPPDGGLTSPSKILLDQMRSVDKIRLQRRMGMVSPSRMRAVDDAIRLSLAV
jgi:mRNA-degrading endonuclease toxin of MazEF toxin-antitoxin module